MKYFVTIGGREIEVTVDGDHVTVNGQRVEARLGAADASPERMLTVGTAMHRVVTRRGEERGKYALWVDGERFDVDAVDERARTIRALAGVSGGPTGPAPVKAPMPGMIVRVLVAEGDAVSAGQGVVVMEAMKMENELRAGGGGTVKRVHAVPGTAVEKGALLLELE